MNKQNDRDPAVGRPFNKRPASWLIVILWRWVNTWTVLGAVLAIYAGFYFLTVLRFQDHELMARMHAWADMLQLRDGAKEAQPIGSRLDALLQHYAKQHEFQFYGYLSETRGGWYGTAAAVASDSPDAGNRLKEAPESFKGAILDLARAEAPSHAFTAAVRNAGREMNRWGKVIAASDGKLSRFTSDSYRYKGVNFAQPLGDMTELRKDAQLFLTHHDIFALDDSVSDRRMWKGFRNAPLDVQLMPWKLLRFYDETRQQLNNKLPLAFGTLLLAAAFLLQFRLVDYRKPRDGSRDTGLNYKPRDLWIPIWRTTKDGESGDSSLLSHRLLRFYMLGGGILMLTVELLLNTPVHRMEWLVNAPIMLVTGIVLPVIWVTLWQLRQRKINRDLATYTRAFRRRVLRPLLFGVLVLAVVSLWGALYSLLDLPGRPPEQVRAVIQVSACGWTLYLLLSLFTRLNRQLRALDQKRQNPTDPDIEKIMNPPESNIVAEFFPGLDERAITVALLGLLPLPMILESFMH